MEETARNKDHQLRLVVYTQKNWEVTTKAHTSHRSKLNDLDAYDYGVWTLSGRGRAGPATLYSMFPRLLQGVWSGTNPTQLELLGDGADACASFLQ